MGVRSRGRLYEDQAAVLAEYRRQQEAAGEGGQWPTAGGYVGPGVWGRVDEVVGEDPEFGPHLVVQPQQFVGSPPEPEDAPVAAARCYPAPGCGVEAYEVGEYVKLMAARGAVIADKSM